MKVGNQSGRRLANRYLFWEEVDISLLLQSGLASSLWFQYWCFTRRRISLDFPLGTRQLDDYYLEFQKVHGSGVFLWNGRVFAWWWRAYSERSWYPIWTRRNIKWEKYMISMTFNAPKESFGDPVQSFFEGRTPDDLFLPTHLNCRFFGMDPLRTFVCCDIMKDSHALGGFQRFELHMQKHST